MVSWIDENRLLVNFLHRNQTQAVLAVCSDQNRKNADYECVEVRFARADGGTEARRRVRTSGSKASIDNFQNNVESSETGWVDISQEPVYDAEKTAYFLKLPVNDGSKGKFFHVAKIGLTVSSGSGP